MTLRLVYKFDMKCINMLYVNKFTMNKLPIEIVNIIYEFASDHRDKFSRCVEQIIWNKAQEIYIEQFALYYGCEAWNIYEIIRLLTTKNEFDKYFKISYEDYMKTQNTTILLH